MQAGDRSKRLDQCTSQRIFLQGIQERVWWMIRKRIKNMGCRSNLDEVSSSSDSYKYEGHGRFGEEAQWSSITKKRNGSLLILGKTEKLSSRLRRVASGPWSQKRKLSKRINDEEMKLQAALESQRTRGDGPKYGAHQGAWKKWHTYGCYAIVHLLQTRRDTRSSQRQSLIAGVSDVNKVR